MHLSNSNDMLFAVAQGPKAHELISIKRGIEDFRNEFREIIIQRVSGNNDLSSKDEILLKDELQKITTIYTLMKVVFDNEFGDDIESYRKKIKRFKQEANDLIKCLKAKHDIKDIIGEVKQITEYLSSCIKRESGLSEQAIKEIFGNNITVNSESEFNFPLDEVSEENLQGKAVAPTIEQILDSDCAHWLSGFYSWKRKAEDLWNEVYEQIFQPQITSGGVNERQAKRMMIKLNLAYSLAKLKFQGVTRESGERYFEHLREVTLISLREGMTKDFDEVLISLLHDIIEDTDISYNTLKELFGERVALGVQLISKPAFSDFRDEGDTATWNEQVESAHILNSKGLLNDAIKRKEREIIKRLGKLGYKKVLEEINSNSGEPNSNFLDHILAFIDISDNELKGLAVYHQLSKKYKDVKNNAYWDHMKSDEELGNDHKNTAFQNFVAHAKKLRDDGVFDIEADDTEIEKICHKALSVKLSDRIHNLRTMKELPVDHIQRNLEDTQILIKIADELNNGFGEKVEELERLCIGLQRFIDEKESGD